QSGRNFIEGRKRPRVELLRALRRLEHERFRAGLHVRFPIPYDQRVLRRARLRLARDHILARDWSVADLDPELPVGVIVAERQMLTLETVDDASADVHAVQDV